MKRYLVFTGDYYYPSGGWEDFHGSYDNKIEACVTAQTKVSAYSWAHVVNTQTGEVTHMRYKGEA